MSIPADGMIDFEAVMLDLRRHGLSYRAISGHVGVAPSTCVDYANRGARPGYDVGMRLVTLWLGVTNSTETQLPRVRLAAAQ